MTMIPPDTDNGDLLVEPTVYCPECLGCVPLDLVGDTLVGCCMCGRQWFVTPQRITAQFLTAKQREASDAQLGEVVYGPPVSDEVRKAIKEEHGTDVPEGAKWQTVKQELAVSAKD